MFEIHHDNGETWVICGGRDFRDTGMFASAMTDLLRLRGLPSRVVQGGARGADAIARAWSENLAVDCITCEAEWDKYGPSAGPRRNQRMLDDYSPNLVVAFPGGKGTASMMRLARAANVDVAEIKPTK